MILFGKNSLIEIIKAGRRPVHEVYLQSTRDKPADMFLFDDLKAKRIKVKLADRAVLDKLAETPKHQGVVFKTGDYQYWDLEQLLGQFSKQAFFVVCDGITDPQNFGAICRSALWFGVDAIIIAKDRSVDVTPAVVKASAGAVDHLAIAKVVNISRALELMKESGFWTFAADAKAASNLSILDPSPKSAVVLGSEGEGIRPLVLKTCDYHFSIPSVNPFDSLNVAQAATIVFYEWARKRGAF